MAENEAPVSTTTQAPAQSTTVKPEEKKENTSGLDLIAKDPAKLRELYKNSPTLFKQIVEEEEKKGKQEPTKQTTKPQSAAPAGKVAKYGEVEIKLPEDVNENLVGTYFDHWKENGWSPEQVQKEVDFQGELAKKARAQQETPEQRAKRLDAANVEILKKDWGKDFDKNMEVARRAALKHGTPEMKAKAISSDPTTVKQFYEFGKLDVEDTTPDRGTPRGGKDDEEEVVDQPAALKKRFPNSPTMKFT